MNICWIFKEWLPKESFKFIFDVLRCNLKFFIQSAEVIDHNVFNPVFGVRYFLSSCGRSTGCHICHFVCAFLWLLISIFLNHLLELDRNLVKLVSELALLFYHPYYRCVVAKHPIFQAEISLDLWVWRPLYFLLGCLLEESIHSYWV